MTEQEVKNKYRQFLKASVSFTLKACNKTGKFTTPINPDKDKDGFKVDKPLNSVALEVIIFKAIDI